MRLIMIASAALFVVACTPAATDKPAEPAAPVAEAPAAPAANLPPLGETPRDRLVGCAGAYAAKANIDTAAKEPTGPDTPESLGYWTMQALLDKEAMPPEARQVAVEAVKKVWAAAPAEALDARLGECRTAFTAQ